jgi:8-oxo-dGTP pyrophosphatase MutT (NUDIX family)
MTVRAAGGLVWRHAGGGLEVVLIHRPKHDDWTLPKGKLEAGEDDAAAAVREVREETGLVCELGPELTSIEYVDSMGRPKVVRYWAMIALDGHDAKPESADEVDEVLWVPMEEARTKLTYPHDTVVLDAFTGV